MEWRNVRGNEQGKKEEEKALDIIVERIGCRLVILGQSFSLFIKTGMDRHHQHQHQHQKGRDQRICDNNKEGTWVAQKPFSVIEIFLFGWCFPSVSVISAPFCLDAQPSQAPTPVQ